ncbi:hypothetical protein BH24ACT5_BH24ACT5_29990 [soil metagenome]
MLIGHYANGGRDWRPEGDPERVNAHDFADPAPDEFAKATPYGVYDIGNDEGWVSVGDTADTAEFAVEAIRRWWTTTGTARFPEATTLTITADGGGSNGSRVRAWKYHLARLAAETGLAITVLHYPPGTSKWNKIEHRLFSFNSMNWRGRPVTSIRTTIELIGATTTTTGLTVTATYEPQLVRHRHPHPQRRLRRPPPPPPRLARRLELHPHPHMTTRLDPRRALMGRSLVPICTACRHGEMTPVRAICCGGLMQGGLISTPRQGVRHAQASAHR